MKRLIGLALFAVLFGCRTSPDYYDVKFGEATYRVPIEAAFSKPFEASPPFTGGILLQFKVKPQIRSLANINFRRLSIGGVLHDNTGTQIFATEVLALMRKNKLDQTIGGPSGRSGYAKLDRMEFLQLRFRDPFISSSRWANAMRSFFYYEDVYVHDDLTDLHFVSCSTIAGNCTVSLDTPDYAGYVRFPIAEVENIAEFAKEMESLINSWKLEGPSA